MTHRQWQTATGFKAIAAASYGLAGSLLGMPDIGVLTVSEMITQYRNIWTRDTYARGRLMKGVKVGAVSRAGRSRPVAE